MSAPTSGLEQLDVVHRPMPPVTELGMASLALIVAGGVYLASNLPHHVSLAPAVALLAVAAATLLANAIFVARLRDFAWDRFSMVLTRALVAYVIVTGMIEYVFVLDHTRGSVLVVMTLMLVVFALDVPLIIAFTAARYQVPEHPRR